MPPPEKQISPEEKLLKVIQGSDKGQPAQVSGEEKLLKVVQGGSKADPVPLTKKPDVAPRATAAAPKAKEPSPEAKQDAPTKAKPAPPKTDKADAKTGTEKVAAATEKAEPKPKLKVAKAEEPAQEAAPAIEPPKTAEKAKPKAVALGMVKKSAGRKFSVRTVNSWLAATVLVAVCLSAYEMWAGVQASQNDPQFGLGSAPTPANGGGGDQETALPDSTPKFLELLKNKDMFSWNIVVVAPTNGPVAPQADWVIYAKDNLKLKAFMGDAEKGTREAIITDKGNQGRMSFLRKGQKFTVRSRDVTVRELQSDQIILTDGVLEQAVR